MIFNKEKRLLNINLAEKHVKNIVSTPIIKLTMKSWSEKKVKYGCCKWLVLVQILHKKYNGKFPNT